jgi:hypothetical protein
MPDASNAQDRDELARAFADASGVPSGSSNAIPSPPTVNPDDSLGDRLFDTSRQFIYVVRHQWKDVLRDSSQAVSEVPGADFFGEVSGVDAAIDAILATGEGDYSGVAIAGSGILLGKLKVAGELTKTVKRRLTPGRDGAISEHVIERLDDETLSVTHRVTREGELLHQHQTHIGRYGSERRFPDEWIEYPTIP